MDEKQKVCPACGSTDTDPRADLVYLRECQDCLFMGPEQDFEKDPDPLWSWHVVSHDGYAFDVVQVRHYPARLEVESLMIRLSREQAEADIQALRATAPRLGRKLAY